MKPFDPFRACLHCWEPVEISVPRGGTMQNMTWTCPRCSARYNLISWGLIDPLPLFFEELEGPKNTVPLTDLQAREFKRSFSVDEQPGYTGRFTREHTSGALPNGTRITKTNSDPGDRTPDGSLGTILGSINAAHLGILYFVEWDAVPKVAVGVHEKRVCRHDPG